jgi:hypothetical protein
MQELPELILMLWGSPKVLLRGERGEIKLRVKLIRGLLEGIREVLLEVQRALKVVKSIMIIARLSGVVIDRLWLTAQDDLNPIFGRLRVEGVL